MRMGVWLMSIAGGSLLLSTSLVAGLRASSTTNPSLTVTLAPITARSGASSIETLGVRIAFDAAPIKPGETVVQIAKVSDNVDTVATTVGEIAARDDRGSLILHVRDVDRPTEHAGDSEAGGPTRQWYADRATAGRITIAYRLPAHAVLPPRGAAPPLDLRNDAGGVSAGGNIILITPPGRQPYRTRVDWVLDRAGKGARGVSSLGEGPSAFDPAMTTAQLRMSYFMGGQLGSWPPRASPASGFFGVWQGKPRFDASELMRWTGSLHANYVRFFDEPKGGRYGVFMRFNPVNAGGGTGLYKSFVITYGEKGGDDVGDLKITLAHEMFHTFQPYITQPAGKYSSWFAEGLAMFYDIALPLRWGMISPAAFSKNVNFSAARYYSSPFVALPNQQVGDGFWKETRIRTIAYDRGMMYFFVVNQMARKASGGKTGLDPLMLEMLRRQRANGETSNRDWEEVLQRHIGPEAVQHFRRALAGEIPRPDSDTFGPCFEKTMKPVRRYEVGFDPSVLIEPRRIVRGLVSGSTAEAAGLRNGDEITEPVPQDGIQGSQDAFLTLKIRRAGDIREIRYLPRGESVDVPQWIVKTGAPSTCAAI